MIHLFQTIYKTCNIKLTKLNMLDIKASKEHCKMCFDTLIASLTKMEAPKWPQNLQDAEAPLFVTWTTTKSTNLRGCIGTFRPSQISKILPQYALISSLQDERFRPVKI
jgi:AMMECR1 domain-containing protein